MDTFVILPDGRLERDTKGLIPEDCTPEQIAFPTVSGDWLTQRRYEDMRLSGETHRMAELLALRAFPGLRTDSEFNRGKFSGEDGRNGLEQQWLARQAEAAGVSPTGKWYCRGLADFPGDPRAWIDGRGDVERIAAEKNLTIHGNVEIKGRQVEPTPDIAVADDLVQGEVNGILAANPGLNREGVTERVTQLRSGAIDPNPLRVKDYDDSVFSEE